MMKNMSVYMMENKERWIDFGGDKARIKKPG